MTTAVNYVPPTNSTILTLPPVIGYEPLGGGSEHNTGTGHPFGGPRRVVDPVTYYLLQHVRYMCAPLDELPTELLAIIIDYVAGTTTI